MTSCRCRKVDLLHRHRLRHRLRRCALLPPGVRGLIENGLSGAELCLQSVQPAQLHLSLTHQSIELRLSLTRLPLRCAQLNLRLTRLPLRCAQLNLHRRRLLTSGLRRRRRPIAAGRRAPPSLLDCTLLRVTLHGGPRTSTCTAHRAGRRGA